MVFSMMQVLFLGSILILASAADFSAQPSTHDSCVKQVAESASLFQGQQRAAIEQDTHELDQHARKARDSDRLQETAAETHAGSDANDLPYGSAFLDRGLLQVAREITRLWKTTLADPHSLLVAAVTLALLVLLCIGFAVLFRKREMELLDKDTHTKAMQAHFKAPVSQEKGSSFSGGCSTPAPEARDMSVGNRLDALTSAGASPALTPARSPQPTMKQSEFKPEDRLSIGEAILCAGLIVPEECECTLLVPQLVPSSISCQVTIEDQERTPALQALFCLPNQEGRCLTLSDVNEAGNMFAFCQRDFSHVALTIYDAKERHFGLIRMRGSKPGAGYEVITRTRAQLQLRCAVDGEPRTFTDGLGRLLAVAEPVPDEQALRVVRIGPGVDAGLVILATLASDLLSGLADVEGKLQ